MPRLALLAAALLIAADASAATTARLQAAERHDALARDSLFNGVHWRDIGPLVQGGRVVEIAAVPGQPYGFYVAYATGGVWKSTNNGVSFEPLTDMLPSMVIGAIAVDATHPQRLWVGTGEANSSRSSYGGVGMFRSDDGGKTFTHVGLADTDRIARIVVDPRNGDHVCAAALGKLYTEGGGRGIYCTTDAGAHWTLALAGENARTGFVDLALDPNDPNTMYAASWERIRKAWDFTEGGRGSAIWKTTDGGAHWSKLAGGLPNGEKVGRIGLAVSKSNSKIVYASVDNWESLPPEQQELGENAVSPKRLKRMSKEEFLRQDPEAIESFIRSSDLDTELDAKTLIEKVRHDELTMADIVAMLTEAEAALFDSDIKGLEIYRSDDAGASWHRTHALPLREVTYTYGYYFGQIRVAPDDPDRVYVLGLPVITSADGGKSWGGLNHPKVHVDYHAFWIDPNDPKRIAVGNDGGIDLTYDGGKTFIKLDAQPVGQFYTVMYDMAEPYNVYGGLQDNGSLKGSSKTKWRQGEDWSVVGGGDGMHVAVDWRDNATFITGYQFGHYDRHGPGGSHEIRPRSKLKDAPLRFNWNTPVVFSTHNADVVYVGTNKLMRSFDKGDTWQAISGDLTTSKHRGDVPYATITQVAESPLTFGWIWVGTDDGHVWLTRGGGDSWDEVGKGLPASHWVSRVEASHFDKDRAYVTLNAYREDDDTAFVYVTDDAGKHWRSIAAGLPASPANVIREDPVNAEVLYVGTDHGVYVSIDRGANWQVLGDNLPHVPVHDLQVHPRERELIAGTHGRSVWIADVLPAQELSKTVRDEGVHVFPLSPVKADRDWRARPSKWFDEQPYLPKVAGTFWAKADGTAKLTVLDDGGHALRELELPAKRGVNSFEWDLTVDAQLAAAAESAAAEKRKADAKPDAKVDETGALAKTPYAESLRLGHRMFVQPGTYDVRIALGDASSKTKLEVKPPEPRKPRAKAKPPIRGREGYDPGEQPGVAMPESVERE